jgi:hypothetical protein
MSVMNKPDGRSSLWTIAGVCILICAVLLGLRMIG